MRDIETIEVRGAREHNLKNVDADVPRGRLVVLSGPSGSGKSSFVFDTIFAEGRRRFLETLSLSSRQIAGQLQRPDVDVVRGLPPTVAVGQALGRAGRLSTVSTLTGIDESLRLLFTRLGQAFCPTCGAELKARSVGEIVARIAGLPERTKLIVHAPLVSERTGDHAELLEQVVRNGFVRVRVDSETVEAADVGPLDADRPHTIEAVVDRLVVKEGFETRLRESIDLAVEHGRGTCVITTLDADRNEHDRLESTRFACPACDVSYPDLDPRTLSFESPYGACETCRGTGWAEDEVVCSACHGDRIHAFARGVVLGEHTLPTVRRFLPEELNDWLDTLRQTLADDPLAVAVLGRLVPSLERRLQGLRELGLAYLSLDREGRTLSGGELQRVRLVSVLASGLSGVCYVLDEPTAGLHPSDTAGLLAVLRRLVDDGSSVLAVEHDDQVIAAADETFFFGPGGGQDGGRLVEKPASPQDISVPPKGDRSSAASLTIRNARLRTLQDIDVAIPLGRIVGVAGVSGSGKTTLVRDVLAAGVRQLFDRQMLDQKLADVIEGVEHLAAISVLDQSPPGRSARSCPATVLKIWGRIRQVLARTKIAKLRGFEAGRFSFNNSEGQCPECRGRGFVTLKLRYLPNTTAVCSRCRGARFEPSTLAVTFKGHSVGDLLRLTVDEAAELFANLERIAGPLRLASESGLGYLTLGQPSDTLSGGEAQRLKLVQTLSDAAPEATLFVLDEPTSGLSVGEVARLVQILRRLTDAEHSVIAVEHHVEFLAACDHVLTLGPGAGPDGGRVVSMT